MNIRWGKIAKLFAFWLALYAGVVVFSIATMDLPSGHKYAYILKWLVPASWLLLLLAGSWRIMR